VWHPAPSARLAGLHLAHRSKIHARSTPGTDLCTACPRLPTRDGVSQVWVAVESGRAHAAPWLTRRIALLRSQRGKTAPALHHPHQDARRQEGGTGRVGQGEQHTAQRGGRGAERMGLLHLGLLPIGMSVTPGHCGPASCRPSTASTTIQPACEARSAQAWSVTRAPRDTTSIDGAPAASKAERLSGAEAPLASARAARACPARAGGRQATALGPGGIARTNPTISPTSRAGTSGHLLAARPGQRPLGREGPGSVMKQCSL
jgi:hypothetical protein